VTPPSASVALVGLEQHVSYVLDGLARAPHLRLVGAARLGEGATAFAREREVPVYDDHRELLERALFDVLAVFLPPHQQAEVVLDGLRAGKHVVADKPLVIEAEDLARVAAESARRPGVEVAMLFTLRGTPAYRALQQVVQSGQIGTPALAYAKRAATLRRDTRARWFFDRRLSGGLMPDLAIHDLDVLAWTTGLRYRQVTAHELNVGNPEDPYMDDAGAALFQMESGVPALIEYHRLLQEPFGGMDYRAKVVGTRGQVELSASGQVTLVTERAKTALVELPPPVNVFVEFVEAVAAGRRPLIDRSATLHAMAAALAARESARGAGAVAVARF
jgi:predicted dehydrogenase